MVGPCFMRRSTGDRFCALMFRKMTISKDPFGARWEQDTKAPRKFRLDPVVAEVGWWVLVVGGECSIDRDYEEEGPVEVYDKRTGVWESAGLMPVVFEGSTCAAWLSVVASSKRLYVMERKSGWLSWFDPESKRWGPVRQMRPDPGVSAWAITVGYGEKLLFFGARRGTDGDGVIKVKIWEVEGDNLRVVDTEGEEMPAEMVDGLFPADEGQDATWQGYSVHVDVCGTEHGGYVCNPNPLWMRKRNGVVLFDLSRSRSSRIVERWEWVPLPERVGDNPMARILCGCSPVDFKHILSGLRSTRKDEEPNKQLQAELRSDVLEKVVMHVLMADLPSASCVSHTGVAPRCALYRLCQLPWLVLRDVCSPKSLSLYMHALDPYSRSWIEFSLSNKPFEMVMPCILPWKVGRRPVLRPPVRKILVTIYSFIFI
ncbi:Kelch repeat-containing F-box-like protein [Rhynchospora pubera]|uniref:Kelch repeat-containing F-box-like protein n=1 Tax=Rhynchospora pubera TaxID=906938 RepID=A0AAV8C3Z2_9POAL|nr:Kelch repeat-containing F-box-like protein [Rhynchospora pubera]